MFANQYPPQTLLALQGGMGGAPPGGPMNEAGPSTIRVTDPSRYGLNPLGGGGATSPLNPMGGAGAPLPPAPQPRGGMFAGGKHKLDLGTIVAALLQGALGFEAGRGVPGAAEQLRNAQQIGQYRMKKRDEDAQTAQYVQALVANGMDPNMATVLAADPGEMAKHIGTRYDAATIDEGSSRYTPNLNGSANVFTAPKTLTQGADVVQMPGSQSVAPEFSSLSAPMGTPQALGSPTSIPGLRTDAQQYADSVAQPGSPQWTAAMQDFSLKGYGPSAQSMLGKRLSTQETIAAGRNATSRANTQFRALHPASRVAAAAKPPKPPPLPTPTTVIGGIMDKQARGEPLTASEASTLREYRTHYKPVHGSVQVSPNEAVATDAHGNKIVVRGGRWVNAATGQPVQ